MTTPSRRLSLDEVLDEFFYSADAPTAKSVLRACEAHPEFRDDIVEFATLWTSYEASNEPTDRAALRVPTEDVMRLQSFVLGQLHQAKSNVSLSVSQTEIQAAGAAIDQLAGGRLARAAKAVGFGDSALLLTKVLTTISNVPARVFRDLGRHLEVAPKALQHWIGPRLADSRSYKSSGVPNVPVQETWENAVRSLPISDEEKKRLLDFQSENVDP